MRHLAAQPEATVTVNRDEENMRLSFRGELGPTTAHVLEQELRRAERLVPGTLTVDISKADFVGAAPLRALLAAANRAWCDGREIHLVGGSDPMWRLLALLGDQVLGLTVQAAPAVAHT
jgi:anti-anti-sigma regulatory factor